MYENTPAALAVKKKIRIAMVGSVVCAIGLLKAMGDLMSTRETRKYDELTANPDDDEE